MHAGGDPTLVRLTDKFGYSIKLCEIICCLVFLVSLYSPLVLFVCSLLLCYYNFIAFS